MELVESAPRPVVGFAKDYPAGLTTGMHTHLRGHLLYAISGVMHVDTVDATYVVPPSTAVYLPANVVHEVRMDDSVAMRALFFREDAASRVGERCRVIGVSRLLREVILAACNEQLDWDLGGKGYYLSELALLEIAEATSLPLDLPIPRDARLRRVVSALRAQPNDPRGLDEWANLASASSRTLARLFRTETGLSFRQWRQHARLVEAMNAISRGTSLEKTARAAGFSSQPAFGAAFRGLFGMTPGQARSLRIER